VQEIAFPAIEDGAPPRAVREVAMPQFMWYVAAAMTGALVCAVIRALVRVPLARRAVLAEVVRTLRGGVVERLPGRGPQARGRLGQLEITVDLHVDPKRREQSPMWRVLAVGPVRLERPIEATVGDWKGIIDPWMELAESRVVPNATGLPLTLHAEQIPPLDHPVVAALQRQSAMLTPGALHARPDLMRAEARFSPHVGENRGLFAYLSAMSEISEMPSSRARHDGPRPPRTARSTHVARPAV
jgi:hypothetical protein